MDMSTHFRKVRFGTFDTLVDRHADGGMVARADEALGPCPAKMTEKLDHWARHAPDRVYLAQRAADGGWRTLTYAQVRATVRAIAQALLDRDLSPDRPIAILSGNDMEHALLGLAAQYAGIPYAPASTAYSLVSQDHAKLRHLLGLVTPGLVFAADGVQFQAAIAAAIPDGVEVVVTRNPPPGRAATLFSDLAATPAGPAVDAAHALVGPDTVAKLLFTSGSTGMPKGVINTQRMLCANQQMLRQVLTFLADEPPILVDWLPWNHTFGGNHNFNMALYNGGSFYIDEGKPVGTQVHATIAALRDVSPTIYFNVPKGYESLLPYLRDEPDLRRRFFSRLNALFYAGAGLAPFIWTALEEMSHEVTGERVPFISSLGSTETAPAALICNRPADQPGIIGVPAPGLEVKLTPSNGKMALSLRGPNITPGYWRQPEMTAKAFDDDGFYQMGDALRFVDPDHPGLGFIFDGRISEDFKLATGTWVSVSTLSALVVSQFAPLVGGVVIAGHDRDFVSMLIFPDMAAARDFCPDFGRGMTDAEVLAAPLVRAQFQERLDTLARAATGSASRIDRALIMDTPPSLDLGETTDKGSLAQRTLLVTRAAMIERLYARQPDADVLIAAR